MQISELQPVEFIYNHVWRPHVVNVPVGSTPGECAYMSCRRPKEEHMRSVSWRFRRKREVPEQDDD